jgi:hypothetical protein
VPLSLHAVQQLLGAPCARRDNHLIGGEGALGTPTLAGGADGDRVAAAGPRRDARDRRERVHDRARRFGQVQVVLDEGVLGVVSAAGHALAALEATVARRPRTAKVRVGCFDAGSCAEVNPDGGEVEAVGHAQIGGDLLHDLVGRRHRGVDRDAEHARRLVVVGVEFGLPVGDVRPLAVGEERIARGAIQRVGVDERATAHSCASEDHHVVEQVDALDSQQPERRRPEELLQIP